MSAFAPPHKRSGEAIRGAAHLVETGRMRQQTIGEVVLTAVRGWPVVAFESPQRLGASLRSLAAVTPERDVVVCRELTKRFEEVVRGAASSLVDRYAEPPKGEITLVLGPPPELTAPGEDAAGEAVAELVAAGTPRKASKNLRRRVRIQCFCKHDVLIGHASRIVRGKRDLDGLVDVEPLRMVIHLFRH